MEGHVQPAGQTRARGGSAERERSVDLTLQGGQSRDLGQPAYREGVELHPEALLALAIHGAVDRESPSSRADDEIVDAKLLSVRDPHRVSQGPAFRFAPDLDGVELYASFAAAWIGSGGKPSAPPPPILIHLSPQRELGGAIGSLKVDIARRRARGIHPLEQELAVTGVDRAVRRELAVDRSAHDTDAPTADREAGPIYIGTERGPVTGALDREGHPTRVEPQSVQPERRAERSEVREGCLDPEVRSGGGDRSEQCDRAGRGGRSYVRSHVERVHPQHSPGESESGLQGVQRERSEAAAPEDRALEPSRVAPTPLAFDREPSRYAGVEVIMREETAEILDPDHARQANGVGGLERLRGAVDQHAVALTQQLAREM